VISARGTCFASSTKRNIAYIRWACLKFFTSLCLLPLQLQQADAKQKSLPSERFYEEKRDRE
jgi:hypothetical protein